MTITPASLLLAAWVLAAAPGADLAGAWAAADDKRPGPVRILDCFPNYDHYTFTRGAAGRWDVTVRQVYHGGPALISFRAERLQGTFTGDRLRLAGEAFEVLAPGVTSAMPLPEPQRITYDLRRDAVTGHLVGTRGGAPFRLARLVLVKPADGKDCGPAPP